MSNPGFWDDQDKATQIAKEADFYKKEVEFWEGLEDRFKEAEDALELSQKDKEFVKEAGDSIQEIEKDLKEWEIKTLFTGKYDESDAVLAIHAGAGGTDAQDWAEMLLRMFTRYAENRDWKVDILSESRGTEAGIKSVVMTVKGDYAYGYLKNEAGVHRLVRLSPFNTANTRETSFALVEVLPLIRRKEVEIDPKDLKIDTSTASGHGGQSVNTTYSAVRITHIPTGITVSIQNERSQHQNKEKALEVLQARLVKLQEEKREKEREKLRGEFHSPEWGNQIRSYVLHPYKMAKDHRTEYETSDVEAVLDGDLDEFIEKELVDLNNQS